MSLAWQNINRRLACRAILFDRRALVVAPGETAGPSTAALEAGARAANLGTRNAEVRQTEKIMAEGKVGDLLQSEIRAELTKRGVSAVGKRWELEQRLQALLDMAQPASQAEAASPAASGPPGPSKASQDFRSKYGGKLSAKLANSLARAASLGALPPVVELGAGWNFQPGLRELMQYVEMRGMQRVLLPSESDDITLTDAAAESQAAHITQALKLTPFSRVLPAVAAAALRGGDTQPLHSLCETIDLLPTELMVVSDDQRVISTSRAAKCFAVYFAKQLPGTPQRIPSSFTIRSLAGVQDSIEDLNGVTFRSPNTEIFTKYGVSVT